MKYNDMTFTAIARMIKCKDTKQCQKAIYNSGIIHYHNYYNLELYKQIGLKLESGCRLIV